MSRLTVDPDRCEYRRIEYGPRDWDQTPRIRTMREIERLMPEISRLAANEITREADLNPIRTVHFNLMAKREFDNTEFERCCQFIADFIELRINDRQIRDATQGLEDSIRAAVTLHATSMVEKYAELDDIVQDTRRIEFIRAVDTNLGRFAAICKEIEEMHLEDQSDMRSTERSSRDDRRYSRDDRDDRRSRGRDDRDDRRTRDDRDDRYSRSRDDRDDRRYGRDDRGDDRARSRQEYDDGRGYGRRGRVDRDDRDDRYGRDDRDSRRYGRGRDYDSDHRVERGDLPNPDDFEGQPKSNQENVRNEPTRCEDRRMDRETKGITEEHKLSGRCNDSCPMFKGIHGSFPLLTPPKGMTEMDMYSHARIYGNGISDAKDMSKEIMRVFTLAQAKEEDEVTSDSIKNEVVVDEEVKIFNNTATMIEEISDQVTINAITESGDNIEGVRKINHTVAVVSNAMIGFENLNDLQKNIRECTTLREIVNFLRRAMDAVNQHANPESAYASDLRGAVEFYDRLITKEINAYCRDVLRISDGDSMQSAVAQMDDLINALAQSGKPELQSALIGHMSTIAINILDGWDKKNGVDEEIIENHDLKDTNIGYTFMPQSYIVTHIPFTMKELGYTINGPTAIQNSELSSFFRVALDISDTKLNKEAPVAGAYRMVVTRDRRAFRLYNYPGRKDVLILAPHNFS